MLFTYLHELRVEVSTSLKRGSCHSYFRKVFLSKSVSGIDSSSSCGKDHHFKACPEMCFTMIPEFRILRTCCQAVGHIQADYYGARWLVRSLWSSSNPAVRSWLGLSDAVATAPFEELHYTRLGWKGLRNRLDYLIIY